MIQKSNFRKILIAGLLLVASGAGAWYFLKGQEGVYPYEAAKDRAFVINLFKPDWYWLISDASAKDYSVEHMLDYQASSKNHTGDLILRVYRIKGQPVGFIAYHPSQLYEGRILFVAVDKGYRGKGIARTMMEYAIDDLKKNHGSTVIRLNTRTDNSRGLKLYKGMGFSQIWTDGAYVILEKRV